MESKSSAPGLPIRGILHARQLTGWLGLVSLATMQAAINLTSFIYMLTIGLATAAAVRVGSAVGRGDWRSAPGGSRWRWLAH